MIIGVTSDTKYQSDDSLFLPQYSGQMISGPAPGLIDNPLDAEVHQSGHKISTDDKPPNGKMKRRLTESSFSKTIPQSPRKWSEWFSASICVSSSACGLGLKEPLIPNINVSSPQRHGSCVPLTSDTFTVSDRRDKSWEVIQIKSNNSRNKRILVLQSVGRCSEKRGRIRIKKPDTKFPQFPRSFLVSNIERLNKCNHENRLLIYFYEHTVKQTDQVIDILFCLAKEQVEFINYLQELNPEVIVETRAVQLHPEWDFEAKECLICGSIFGVLNRKHHCRMCGRSVCAGCSKNRAVLPKFGIEIPVRVDIHCYDIILAERLGVSEGGFGSCKMMSWQEAIKENAWGFCSPKLELKAMQCQTKGKSKKVRMQQSMSNSSEEWKRYLAENRTLDCKSEELRKKIMNGIPPEFRGHIWTTISQCSKKRRNKSENYYFQLLEYANRHTGELGFMSVMEKDLSRSMQKDLDTIYSNRDAIEMLRRVLVAYGVRNRKVEYCQSFNYIVALLLLFTSEEDAFWLFCHIVEEICCVDQRAFYHSRNLEGWSIDRIVFTVLVEKVLPEISQHLVKFEVPITHLADNWFLCLFVDSLPLETTLRIWDLMFLDGIRIIFRSALALLSLNSKKILAAGEYGSLSTILMNSSSMVVNSDRFIKLCWSPELEAVDDLQNLRVFHRAHVEQTTRLNDMRKLSNRTKSESVVSTMSNRLRLCSRAQLMYRIGRKSTDTQLLKYKCNEVSSLRDLAADSSLNDKEKKKVAEIDSPLIYLDPAYRNRFAQFSQYFGRIEVNTRTVEEYFRANSRTAEQSVECKEYPSEGCFNPNRQSIISNRNSIDRFLDKVSSVTKDSFLSFME